jgi:hypothetical protein
MDPYIARLERELQKRFVTDPAFLDEVRGHLSEAVARGRETGLDATAADDAAIARFGSAELVAETFAADRSRTSYRILMVCAIACGLAIAYVDSRPNWDDAGITAGLMVLVAAAFGVLGPRRPWLWALAVGIWIPAHAIADARSSASGFMPLVLLFPLGGAWLGRLLRSTMSRPLT